VKILYNEGQFDISLQIIIISFCSIDKKVDKYIHEETKQTFTLNISSNHEMDNCIEG